MSVGCKDYGGYSWGYSWVIHTLPVEAIELIVQGYSLSYLRALIVSVLEVW